MRKLALLFTKGGLQWQLQGKKFVLEEEVHFLSEGGGFLNFIEEKLEESLSKKKLNKIEVFSAINHFSLVPSVFSENEMGYKLIRYNSWVDEQEEELMLTINRKYMLQFYYSFPRYFYERIKKSGVSYSFNFTGEKFLNSILGNFGKEIHIHLYHHQVEFIVLEDKKVILYNNLDSDSEVDFLYFILFTVNKLGFSVQETNFFLYGELRDENETFISELKKFAPLVFEQQFNRRGNHFIFNY